MSDYGLGIAASLGAPLLMTIGFYAFDIYWAGSSYALNLFKCNLASLGFLLLAVTTRSDPFPSEIFQLENCGYLFLSSTAGILLGDWLWLEGLQIIGAQKVIFVDSLKPFLSAFLGWLVFDEEIRWGALAGIVLTAAGIGLVAWEREKDIVTSTGDEQEPTENPGPRSEEKQSSALTETPSDVDLPTQAVELTVMVEEGESSTAHRQTSVLSLTESTEGKRQSMSELRGYLFCLINVVMDTYGSVLTRQFGAEFTVWEINLLRFGFAGGVMLLLSSLMTIGANFTTSHFFHNEEENKAPWYALPLQQMTRSSWAYVVGGVALVTFLTPTLSNYALFQIALALALTLGSVGPLYALPLGYLMKHELITPKAFVGAVLAISGIVVLAFRGTLPDE